MRRKSLTNVCLIALLALWASCSNSGGSTTAVTQPGDPGAPADPGLPVSVPDGAGLLAIDMVGTWTIAATEILDTNSPNPEPPIDGTVFQFETDRIATIGGLSVDPFTLQGVLGAPLATYVNMVDGSVVLYHIVVDTRSSGGVRAETALAGGSIGNNVLLVEAYNSVQTSGQVDPLFTRSRYVLLRTTSATPLIHEPEALDIEDLLRRAFGGY